MKYSIWALIGLLAGALLVFSCSKKEDEDELVPVLKLSSPTMGAEGGSQWVKVAAEKTWTLSVEYAAGSGDWVSLEKTSGEGSASVYMTVTPNEGDNPRRATVVLKTRKYEDRKELVQAGNVASSAPLWLELPALDQPQLGFFTHAMDGSAYISREKSGVRNWSFYYDYTAFVSWWVAYPLNKGLRGSGSRTDNWQATDPLLPASAVCDLSSGSYGGGWTRGHQIPSADRLDYVPNITTFYPTNMTPQDYDFNCYIWADLENAVRTYSSNCDTLYVVTGADVRNSNTWSGYKAGHAAKVPTHYYKALLRRKGNSYSAVGFYLPHASGIANNDYRNYSCSIDELEQHTGVDFFASLPAFLGADEANAIEAADPATTLKNW